MKSQKLLSFNNDAKTVKGLGEGYYTGILYLIPDFKLCPMSRLAACHEACLVTAGRAGFDPNVNIGRQRKTDLFYADPVAFVDYLAHDIKLAQKRAYKHDLTLAIRLNGTSDIPWENYKGSNGMTLFEMFPDVIFYDYTKLPNRKVPANYHLTVSYSGANAKYVEKVKKTNHNIAVVFRNRESIPSTFLGRKVIDGDKTDLRFTDPQNVIVALYAKGSAKKDDTGFVVDVPDNIIAMAA